MDCAICLNAYSSTADERKPRLLVCGHSLCLACLRRIYKQQTEPPSAISTDPLKPAAVAGPVRFDVILCPFERSETPLGASGVEGLTVNRALIEAIRDTEPVRGQPTA